METPSESETPIEDQNDKASTEAAEAAPADAEEGAKGRDMTEEEIAAAGELLGPGVAGLASELVDEMAGDGIKDDTAALQALVDAPPDDAEDAEDAKTVTDEVVNVPRPFAAHQPKPLPTFECHKKVQAFLIAGAEALSGGSIRLAGVDADISIVVGSDYVDKHHPAIGGYYVRYHDGYESWSPADAFEDGYTQVAE